MDVLSFVSVSPWPWEIVVTLGLQLTSRKCDRKVSPVPLDRHLEGGICQTE
jgi:hypothetical protein